MSNSLSRGGQLDMRKTQDILWWYPKNNYGENWKVGDCSGYRDSFGKECLTYTLHYKSYLRSPAAYPQNKFIMLPQYRMYLFNQTAISLN